MRVLLIGAYGFIGSAIARRLTAQGHDVRAMGRNRALGERLMPDLPWLEADLNRMTAAANWAPMLEGVDAVVNASGALQSGGGDSLQAIQGDSVVALVEACEAIGVERFVQISAPGARICDDSEFMATKGRADARLAASRLHWAILRPTLVIGRNAHGGSMLIRSLAAQPGILFLINGAHRVQTVALADVADAVSRCLLPATPRGLDAALAAREEHEVRDLILAHRRWLGLRAPLAVIGLPALLARPVTLIADALGHLGWRSPLRSTAMAMVVRDVIADPAGGEALLGRRLESLEETLAANPAGIQDRRQARLALLLPLIIGSLALLWLSSGIIGLVRMEAVMAALDGTGIAPPAAWLLGAAGGCLDIALGLAILVRRWTGVAALGMVAVTIVYLLAGSVVRPDLWIDPLAPLVKAIPALVLALVALAIAERR